MSYRVQIKQGHPTGARRRSGQLFIGAPIEVESITDEMRADPWLQIVEIPELIDREPTATSDAGRMEESGASRPSRASRASRK